MLGSRSRFGKLASKRLNQMKGIKGTVDPKQVKDDDNAGGTDFRPWRK